MIDLNNLELQDEKDYEEAREEFIARMEEEGFKAVYPSDSQLQIDIDNEQEKRAYRALFKVFSAKVLDDYGRTPEESWKPSLSGGEHWHITVTLPFVIESPWQRVALQAALGSDRMRELLSGVRLLRGDTKATLFLEKV